MGTQVPVSRIRRSSSTMADFLGDDIAEDAVSSHPPIGSVSVPHHSVQVSRSSADPPLAVTAAEQSKVREPTPDELKNLETIKDIATWARARGDPAWAPSPLGSLLRLLAGFDDIEEPVIPDSSATEAGVTYLRGQVCTIR